MNGGCLLRLKTWSTTIVGHNCFHCVISCPRAVRDHILTSIFQDLSQISLKTTLGHKLLKKRVFYTTCEEKSWQTNRPDFSEFVGVSFLLAGGRGLSGWARGAVVGVCVSVVCFV